MSKDMEEIKAEEKLLSVIPFGKDNAISRKDLMNVMECSERELRLIISLARQDAVIINNQCANGGYYQTDDVNEIQKWVKQETHRAKSIFGNLKGANKILKGIG